jgi:ATP-dependent RNA helicase DeaD
MYSYRAMAIAFESLKLRPELIAACRKQGFRTPTPIQALVLPVAMQDRDAIVEAKTGSGKTLAYGLPLLNVDPVQAQFPEALVIVPTRELASQVEAALTRTSGTLGRRVVALTGGGGMDRQVARLKAGVNIAVATFGRLEELVERGHLHLQQVRTLVLDEVDELMHGGFSGNLAKLLQAMPNRRQTLIFSASISHEVEQVTRQFMRDPKRLQLTPARDVPAELTHRVLRTTVKERVSDLADFLEVERPYQMLLFCGTRNEAETVQEALVNLDLDAKFLHGELSPAKRRRLLQSFHDGELPILVATDLAARGLDLPGVDLVVNYSLPEGPAAYMHRAGRTGRAGKPGVVVTLLIEQQHGPFENLKQTVPFERIEVRGRSLVVRPLKTREERDLEFRQLPRGASWTANTSQDSAQPASGALGANRRSPGAKRSVPRPARGSATPARDVSNSSRRSTGPSRRAAGPERGAVAERGPAKNRRSAGRDGRGGNAPKRKTRR